MFFCVICLCFSVVLSVKEIFCFYNGVSTGEEQNFSSAFRKLIIANKSTNMEIYYSIVQFAIFSDTPASLFVRFLAVSTVSHMCGSAERINWRNWKFTLFVSSRQLKYRQSMIDNRILFGCYVHLDFNKRIKIGFNRNII